MRKDRTQKNSVMIQISKYVALLCWGTFFVTILYHKKDISIESMLNFTPENLFVAALVLILMFAIKSLSIILYSGLLYGISGHLFPIPMAIVVNLLGTIVMVTLPYWIGRWQGITVVNKIVEHHPKVSRIKQFRQGNDLTLSFLLRFFGILPADVVSLYMGAIAANYWEYLAGSLLGMLPMTVLFPIMGNNITHIKSPKFLIAFLVELLVILGSFLGYHGFRKRFPSTPSDNESPKNSLERNPPIKWDEHLQTPPL